MCVSTAMAKCVISAGSALAPDLHEKYPSRSACYLIYLFFLSVCSSRLHLVLVRLPASSVVYAPTALSPTHTHTHIRAPHWMDIDCIWTTHSTIRSDEMLRIEVAKQRIFSFFLFFPCLHYCRRHDNRIHRLLPSPKKKMRVEKRPISLSSLFNVLLPST